MLGELQTWSWILFSVVSLRSISLNPTPSNTTYADDSQTSISSPSLSPESWTHKSVPLAHLGSQPPSGLQHSSGKTGIGGPSPLLVATAMSSSCSPWPTAQPTASAVLTTHRWGSFWQHLTFYIDFVPPDLVGMWLWLFDEMLFS